MNTNGSGTSVATIGDVNESRPMVGVTGGSRRTMNVVETVRTSISGSPSVRKNLNTACAFTVNCTNDPHGADGLTVPVQLQLLPLGNVPATSWPPGPNRTFMLLPVSVQFAGVVNEMFPRN